MYRAAFACYFLLCAANDLRDCFDKNDPTTEHHLVREIFSIQEPTWVFKTGVQRAEFQDRQDLGFILHAGFNLRVRQVNQKFENAIILLFLPFDETHSFLGTPRLEVFGEWRDIVVKTDSVPFADTPYGNASARLEFYVSCSGVAHLPVYQPGDNETKFFLEWTEQNSSYAIARNGHIQLLIPMSLRYPISNLRLHSNVFECVDDMLDFFKSFIIFLDTLLGLDGSSYVNQIPQNRHFMTTTKSKWFYDSFQLRHLDLWIQQPTVELLSEISGGYYYLMQQTFLDDDYLENYYYSGNILRKFYNIIFELQYFEHFQNSDNLTTSFTHLKFLEATEEQLYRDYLLDNNIFSGTTVYSAEVIFLLILSQSAGTNAVTEMHKGYRSMIYQDGFTDVANTILLNKYSSEYSLMDYTPLFERWGYSISSNKWSMYPAVAMLVDVVPAHALPAARALLAHRVPYSSNFQLVLNEDILPLGLKGDLTLFLKPDNRYFNYKGTHVFVKDGDRVIRERIIRRNVYFVQFKSLPVGIYTVEFRGKMMQEYIPSQQYVYVNEKHYPITIYFKYVDGGEVLDPLIDFYGHNNKPFASLSIMFTQRKKTLRFKVNPNNLKPPPGLYASVKVTNENGTKYEKIIKEVTENVKDVVNLEEGDIIKVYHNETEPKLRSKNTIIDFYSKKNSWLVTTRGLINLKFRNNPLICIDLCAEAIFRDILKRSLSFYLSEEKKQLLAAIRSLPARHRQLYFGKYGMLFPQPPSSVTLVIKSENFRALEGLQVQLENNDFVQQRTVRYGEVHFHNLPFGEYFIKFPNEELRYLNVRPTRIFVNTTDFVKKLVFKKIRKINLSDAFIKYTASTNATIDKIVISTLEGVATISVIGVTEFPGLYDVKTYMSVKSSRGFEKFNKIIEGTNATAGSKQSVLEPGDVIEVYRSNAVDQLKQMSTWTVTDYGIQRLPGENLKERIDAAAIAVETDLAHLSNAILSLPEPDRVEYRKKYNELLSCYDNETRTIYEHKQWYGV